MPHHAVVRSLASTTKIQVVFNASVSSKNKTSLNDHLDSRPSLLPGLTGFLLRLREFNCAFEAVIKPFFMIAVRPEDRVYLRFVWPNPDGKVVTWRLKRVPFGVNCSPFLINATIRHHLQQEKQNFASEEVRKIVDKMQDSFYVYDCLSILSVREQVDEFQTGSCEIMLNANMELRKWRRHNIKSSEDAGTKVLGWHEILSWIVCRSERSLLTINSGREEPCLKFWQASLILLVLLHHLPLLEKSCLYNCGSSAETGTHPSVESWKFRHRNKQTNCQ